MYYRLRNKSKIPSKLIHEAIEFVCPKGLNNFHVYCADDNETFWGRAYTHMKRVRIYINKKTTNMYNHQKIYRKGGYVYRLKLKNYKEILVSLLAHELRHLWQINCSKRDFSKQRICQFTHWDGTKLVLGYKMEKDATLYSVKMLHKYRTWKQQ